MGMLIKFAVLLAVCLVPGAAMAAWEPEKPVELIVPSGANSSLDQMARLIQDIVIKYKLMKQELVVLNKSGGAGAEGFFLIKTGYPDARGSWFRDGIVDPHRIMIADNRIFTTPLSTGIPFAWKDISPVTMLAFEPFILWTSSEKGYKSAWDLINAAKAAGPNKVKMAGVGSKQEDYFLNTAIERATGANFSYIPALGRDATVLQLLEQRVDATLSHPFETSSHWSAGALTPHCVFTEVRISYPNKVTRSSSWNDVPTCKEAGLHISYQALRGIFMSPGVTEEQMNYFIALFQKATETTEWKAYMERGAYTRTFMTGRELGEALRRMEEAHKRLVVICDVGPGCT